MKSMRSINPGVQYPVINLVVPLPYFEVALATEAIVSVPTVY